MSQTLVYSTIQNKTKIMLVQTPEHTLLYKFTLELYTRSLVPETDWLERVPKKVEMKWNKMKRTK